ncbi:MAG: hypothetical protein MK078_18150 [Crocinitomicaceae bacterium]|nr:hypothetical protein [Crocinitomicaceae bacterium]
MDKKTKTWVVLIGGGILILLAISILMKFWQMAIVGAVAFGFGYYLGVKRRKTKAKKN